MQSFKGSNCQVERDADVSKKQVLVSICDSCGVTEEHDYKPKPNRAEYTLPKGWVHVRADERKVTVFALDLCTECFGPIRDLAGKHRPAQQTIPMAEQQVA